MKNFRSGFVSIIGYTNVGKSSLLNKFIGEKISIVANKLQTTRDKILGIITDQDAQIIFIDTPGIFQPRFKLDALMIKTIERALCDIDLVLFIIDCEKNKFPEEIIKKISVPIFLVINKIDKIKKDRVLNLIARYEKYNFAEIIPVSVLTGENLNKILELIKKYLPIGDAYYPEDIITDLPEKKILAEIIREKILLYIQDEIPHGVAVEIDNIKYQEACVNISAVIYCEKESHKKIIIGSNGSLIKKIGIAARKEIANFLTKKIDLRLWVKVKKNWRNNNFYLKQFGYDRRE